MGRLPVHAGQPEGAVPRAVVPYGGLPTLVLRRPRHGDARVPGDVPDRGGAARMSGRRLPEGGNRIDRTRPIRFTFDGVDYEGFEGDTLASALLANGVVGGFTSPILGRPRGIFTSGVDELDGRCRDDRLEPRLICES